MIYSASLQGKQEHRQFLLFCEDSITSDAALSGYVLKETTQGEYNLFRDLNLMLD